MSTIILQWKLPALILLALVTGVVLFTAPALAQEDVEPGDSTVTVVTIDEEIRAGTVQFIRRSLEQAVASEHAVFILELNTPGGLLNATESISRLLIDSPIPTVVYVDKDSGRALSAGVYILLSADTAASHPTATLGAAAPLQGDGSDADEKTRNATVAWLRSLAERNDRDPEVAEALITENRTYVGSEALETGLIDQVADTRAELLAALGYADAAVSQPQPTAVDATLSFFSIPYLVPILLTLGTLGLFLAVRTGEVEVTGAISLVLLLLGLWGAGMIGLSALGVTVLVVGIGLIVLEVFLGGSDFGASGVIGVITLLFGVALFAQEPLFPDVFSYGLFPVLLAVALAGAGIMFGISYFTASAIRQPHATGTETLVGRTVPVHQRLAPHGVVLIDGERYTARIAEPETVVESGQSVVVVAMEGNIAVVQPAV